MLLSYLRYYYTCVIVVLIKNKLYEAYMMVSTLTMICLANSYKLGGRCIAGIALDAYLKPTQWIRLIGHNHPNGLTLDDYRYHNYQHPNVFDVARVS